MNKKLAISNEQARCYQSSLAEQVGRTPATVFQHIYYHTRNRQSGLEHEGNRYIYATQKDMGEALGLSERTIRRAVKNLKDNHLIDVQQLSSFATDKKNYYAINEESLREKFPSSQDSLEDHAPQNHREKKATRCKDAPLDATEPASHEDKMAATGGQNGLIISDIINKSNQSSENEKMKDEKGEDNAQPQEKPTTVQDMTRIWNEEVGEKLVKTVHLTKERARFLMGAFKFRFKTVGNWRSFCKAIAASDFLMGRKSTFRITIDWALQFSNLQKIIEGNFGVIPTYITDLQELEQERLKKDQQEQATAEKEQYLEEIKQSDDDEEIKNLKIFLLLHLAPCTYRQWFHKETITIKHDERIIFLTCPTLFQASVIYPKYMHLFEAFFNHHRISISPQRKSQAA